MPKPDLCYDRAQNECLPSWSGTEVYLNTEHAKIWEMTRDIGGWQEPGDSYKLYEMAFHAGDVILEIGTYRGKSAVVEILGARANPERNRVQWFGVDVKSSAIRRTRATLEKWKLTQDCTLFCGDAAAFFRKHPIAPTMVFVDGDHCYEGVTRDIEMLSSFLARDVPVLFHDFSNLENKNGNYGIERACNEWEQSGRVKFMGCFGCSALFITATDPLPRVKASFWQRWGAAWARPTA
jgi:hypothetical protein